MKTALTGYRIACATLLYSDPTEQAGAAVPRGATAAELETRGALHIELLTDDEASHSQSSCVFNTDEADQISDWLERAGEGPTLERAAEVTTVPRRDLGLESAHQLGVYREELDGETSETVVDRVDDAVRLIYVDDDESDVILLSTEQSRELAQNIRIGLSALQDSPPCLLPDVFVGRVMGLGSDGRLISLGIEVLQGVSRDEIHRLTLDFLGTWFLDDSSTDGLTNGLKAGADAVMSGAAAGQSFLSLKEGSCGGGEHTWLSISTAAAFSGRVMVRLRLWDELVKDRGDDGIIDFLAVDARTLASFLHEGREHTEKHPPYIFKSPEPFPREIVVVRWDTEPSVAVD